MVRFHKQSIMQLEMTPKHLFNDCHTQITVLLIVNWGRSLAILSLSTVANSLLSSDILMYIFNILGQIKYVEKYMEKRGEKELSHALNSLNKRRDNNTCTCTSICKYNNATSWKKMQMRTRTCSCYASSLSKDR